MNALTYYFRIATLLCVGLVSTLQAVAEVPDPVAYVTNQGGGVTVLNARTLKQVDEIAVGKDPRGLAVTPDGRWLLTANQGSADVSVVDTATRKEIRRIAVGRNVEFMRLSPDGRRAFVTYEPSSEGGPPGKNVQAGKEEKGEKDEAPAEVAIIDLNQWAVVGRIKAARETEAIEFSPEGKLLLVANEGDNTVGVYELSTLKQIRSVDVAPFGNRPRGIKIAPDGKTYVVTLENSNNLLLLDAAFKPIRTVPTGQGPYGIAFDREGRYLWVAASRADQLQVFDARTFAPVAAIPVGKRCWHFSFMPGDQKLLLACGRSNTVQVIDPQKREVVDALPGYKLPWGVVTYPTSVGTLDAPR
ncbi:beta-propeller fold lactonase family protein [Ralstonia wenshanensis]|uniref:beta-propeller fold lactonase family protein n=1 Tax=Ralstonia TaxID=48736 RepID=UPI001E3911DE|nr:beta-propeller fold lactonase family protein [Ralstonia wenshanensis]UGS89979.1 beta-propeller fold lactonase family protein [Ralstonia wenshanensis]